MSIQTQIGTNMKIIRALVAAMVLTSHKINRYVKDHLFIDGRQLTGFARCVLKKYLIVDRSAEYLRQASVDYVVLLTL